MSKLFYEHITKEILKQSDLREKEIIAINAQWEERMKNLARGSWKGIAFCRGEGCTKVRSIDTLYLYKRKEYVVKCSRDMGCINGYCKEHLILGVNMFKNVKAGTCFYDVVCKDCYEEIQRNRKRVNN